MVSPRDGWASKFCMVGADCMGSRVAVWLFVFIRQWVKFRVHKRKGSLFWLFDSFRSLLIGYSIMTLRANGFIVFLILPLI